MAEELHEHLRTFSLFPHIPLDRYCFCPCSEQITTGECDCTRRIKREVKLAIEKETKGTHYENKQSQP